MIWATVSFWSCVCWLCRASPSLAAKNMINLISALAIWWCSCLESSLVLLEEWWRDAKWRQKGSLSRHRCSSVKTTYERLELPSSPVENHPQCKHPSSPHRHTPHPPVHFFSQKVFKQKSKTETSRSQSEVFLFMSKNRDVKITMLVVCLDL